MQIGSRVEALVTNLVRSLRTLSRLKENKLDLAYSASIFFLVIAFSLTE
jgi:hypothetical protein